MNNGLDTGSIKLSNDATAIVDHIKTHYKSLGKTMAAQNYSRHVRRFFEWAEGNGLSITNLPSDAPERFIQAQGHKPTTEYVLRTQLKSALKEAHLGLGANFGHLEYEANKPPEVIKAQVDRAKARNQEKRIKKQALENGIDPETVPALTKSKKELKARAAEAFNIAASRKMEAILGQNSQDVSFDSPGEPPMAAPEVYAEPTQVTPTQVMPTVASTSPQQTVVSGGNGQAPTFIINTTPTGVSPAGRPTNTIANAANGVNPAARTPMGTVSAPSKTVLINNQTFSGPFIKINRIADGSEPLIPPGTETFVTTIPTAQVAPHGDVAGFLQNYLIPSMRLSPMVSQVHFVFHELNDKRSPTGRRDELIVAVPSMGGYQNGYQGGQSFGGQPFGGGYGFAAPPPPQAPQSPVVVQLEQPSISGMSTPVNVQPPRGDDKFDRATEILLKKLDREADDARQRAMDLEKRLTESRDTHTTFLLMQQMQKENEMRQKLEDQKREAVAQQDRMQEEERRRNEREEMRRMMEMQMQNNRPSYEPPPWAMTPPPPAPQVEVMPRPDSSAEMAKAFAESQAKMMEAMMNGLAAARNVPPPPPPPPQKDAAEWLVPMMTQMTSLQQAQAQAQAAAAQRQQEMMMQMQAENMKLVIAMQSSQAQSAQAANDKMMQMFMGLQQRESPETAVLREQLRQSQNQVAGLSQREDEIDSFLQKYQQIQQMTEIVKGGGATNLLGGIVENFGQIAQGAAHIMGAMNAQKAGAAAPPPPPPNIPMPQPQQLAGVPTPQPLPSPKAPEPVGESKPPEECIKALESISSTQDEEEMVNGFVEYMKGLNTSPDKLFQVQLERVLKVFQQCEDDEDVYTLCKQLWIIMGMKADKAAAKKLASAITKWYPLIHKSFFGEARMLPNLDKPLAPDVAAALEGGAGAGNAPEGEEDEGEEDEEEGDVDEE